MRLDIKFAILKSGLAQYAVAKAIGVTEDRLSKYVHGRAKLQPEQEAKLEELLHLRGPSVNVVTASDGGR